MRFSWTLLTVVACAAGGASLGAESPVRSGKGPTTRPSVDALVEQLGDRRFAVRNGATARLSELPPEALDELVRRYLEEPRYERKLRLRDAIERVFYRKLMTGQAGFLGITMAPQSLSGVYDPDTGQMVECVSAYQVLDGGAAQQAGLRAKDIILKFDGQPVGKFLSPPVARADMKAGKVEARGRAGVGFPMTTDPAIEAFTSHVKMREPGTRIPVRVLREGSSRQVAVSVGEGPERRVDAGTLASTLLAGERSGALGFSHGAGLVVTHVPERSWLDEAGLQVHDAIVKINGQPVSPAVSVEVLDRVFSTAGPQGQVVLEVRPLEVLEFTVTLGSRPAELMNLPDWNEAQMRFAAWWRDASGAPSLRVPKLRELGGMATGPDAEVVP